MLNNEENVMEIFVLVNCNLCLWTEIISWVNELLKIRFDILNPTIFSSQSSLVMTNFLPIIHLQKNYKIKLNFIFYVLWHLIILLFLFHFIGLETLNLLANLNWESPSHDLKFYRKSKVDPELETTLILNSIP